MQRLSVLTPEEVRRQKLGLKKQKLELLQIDLWEKMLDERTPEIDSLNIFMFSFSRTFDPPDTRQQIKHMPDKEYLRDLNDIWLSSRYIVVPKSRQMLCTWWATDCYVWDTIRHRGRFTLFKSIDKQHSGLAKLSLLWRAKFIVEHLPECVRPKVIPHRRIQILEFPETDGHIQAMSMEGEAVRTYTATGCFDDELAVQQHGEAGFAAVMPLLGTTGRYTGLFTYMGLEWAYRLAFDKMDDL